MVASNGFGSQPDPNLSGIDGFQDEIGNAKNRALASLKALGKKVYLDKLSPSLGEKLGLGELEDGTVIMLDDPMQDIGEVEDFDTSEVDDIIRQLEEGNVDEIIEESTLELEEEEESFLGADLGAFGNPEILELEGTDALELNAVA